jgi:hypothetical protein
MIRSKASERIKFELDTVQERKGVEYLCEIDHAKHEVTIMVPLVEIKLSEALPADGALISPLLSPCPSHPPMNQPAYPAITDETMRDKLAQCGPALLYLRFTAEGQAVRTAVSVKVPSLWSEVFGPFPKAPSWATDSCLVDFLPQIVEHITDHMKSYQLRKNYILEMIKQVGCVLEYDTADWRKAAFLVEHDQVGVIIHCASCSTLLLYSHEDSYTV